MKKFTIAAVALMMGVAINANAEDLKITFADGTSVSYNIDRITEMTFAESAEEEGVAGTYSGEATYTVGTMGSYTANAAIEITENADGTINFKYPEIQLAGTVMGDLTIGEITIPNIPFDEAKGAYYLNYSELGLTQHFSTASGSMDGDYVLGDPSEITVKVEGNTVTVTNPMKLGKMPFPLTATFTGSK